MAVGKRREGPGKGMAFVKRGFDIVASVSALAIFSPFMLAVGAAIKREDRGPAVFKQKRVGKNGKEFTLYKFRSMILESEDEGPQLSRAGGDGDSRLTKVGKWIRAHHLDELPQLWNVVRGDMSFVGYRPERQFFIDKIMELRPDYERLYVMRPGLFSYATLYNGYTDTIEKMITRLDMDLDYLENGSISTDIKIIYRTAMSILTGKKF